MMVLYLIALSVCVIQITASSSSADAGLNFTGPICNELIDSFTTRNRNDFVPLCLVISNATFSFKTLFYAKVDEFTLFEVDNSWSKPNDFWGETVDNLAGFKIHVEVNGERSDLVKVQANGNHVPYWTITVQLENGALNAATPFVWDNDGGDGCYGGCDEAECLDGFCAVDVATCGADEGSSDCDLKVYVGWYGTDANGNYLTSASKRLSQFRQWSVVELFTAATAIAAEELPDPDQLINDAGDFINP